MNDVNISGSISCTISGIALSILFSNVITKPTVIMWQEWHDHPRLYRGDCWATPSGWLWSTTKAQRAIWYAYPLGRQVILCVSRDGKQCSRVNLSQFLLKAASTTSSFSLNRERPLLNQHYRPSHTILGSVPPPPSFFNINFSVRPQRARVLHNKIAISLRPHPKRYKAITVKPGQANPPRFH